MPPSEASAPGSIGKKQTGIAQVIVQLLARDARLHGNVEILRVDRDDLAHATDVDADAAGERRHMAFERGAGAKGNHRRPMPPADADDLRDLLGREGERHRVGIVWCVERLVSAVLRTYGCRRRQSLAEKRMKLGRDDVELCARLPHGVVSSRLAPRSHPGYAQVPVPSTAGPAKAPRR